MAEPRFYVLEHAGYPMMDNGAGSRSGRTAKQPTVEVMILDRSYCHRVVWSSWAERSPNGLNRWLDKHRAEATALCAERNAENAAA